MEPNVFHLWTPPQEWTALDDQITALVDAWLRAADKDVSRTIQSQVRDLIDQRTPGHVAYLERQRGLR